LLDAPSLFLGELAFFLNASLTFYKTTMSTPPLIIEAITRLVKPDGTKVSTRETLEAHADRICSDHNRILTAMVQYLDTGEPITRQIKDWATEVNRNNPKDVAVMRGVLQSAMLAPPVFQGLSDARALEVYGRLLLNLYNLEVIGQPPLA
jgi:hypothetical protein